MPVPMRAGDWVEVRCHYTNKTPKTVNWGESSLDEMCFAIATRPERMASSFARSEAAVPRVG